VDIEVKLPQWGMGMTEGEILEWLKNDGDRVTQGEPLVEVEAAKATEVVDSPASGILQIVAQVGDIIEVREVIAVIRTEDG